MSLRKGARAALIRLSVQRPDLIDARPLRIVGSAITEDFPGAQVKTQLPKPKVLNP